VSGTRSARYLGTIDVERFFPAEGLRVAAWSKAGRELLDALRDEARALGANAVVGLAISVDPFAVSKSGEKGMRLHAAGTAVRLAPEA
jgi:uncharacterized protein YbjQ (UPF0145 family)